MPYTPPAMTDGVSQLNKTNMQAWLQTPYDQALTDAPGTFAVDPRKVGAGLSASTANATANTTTLNAALAAAGDGAIGIPAGTWPINGILDVPSRCTVHLYGKLQAVSGGSFSATTPMIRVRALGSRNSTAIIGGGGQLLCNRVAGYGVELDSSHGFRCSCIEINDALTASLHVWSNQVFKGNWNASTNTPSLSDGVGTPGDNYNVSVAGTRTFGPGNTITFAVGDFVIYSSANTWTNARRDTDDWVFDQITHRTDSSCAAAAADASLRPPRFAKVEPGNIGGVADGTFRDCYVEGLAAGGWGFEIIDGGRIAIDGKCVADNARAYAGGVWFRHLTTKADQIAHTVKNLYVEAQFGTGSNVAVQFDSPTAGQTNFSRWHIVEGLRYTTDLGANGKRLVLSAPAVAGKITQIQYRQPRNILGQAGNITIGTGANGNIVEVLGTTGVGSEAALVTDNGANNNIIGLQSVT